MAFRKFHKPFAATIALLSIGSLAVLACSDDDGTIPQDGFDAGPGVKVPEAGSDPDTGPVATDEYTVDIGAGFATACALSNKGHVKCWGDAVDGEMLSAPQQGKTCFDAYKNTAAECDWRTPTDLAIPYAVEQLNVGYLTTCVIANDNGTKKLGCWGTQDTGRLSSYAPDASALVSTIVWIPFASPPKRITGGTYFKLVELDDGSLWGWGDNSYGHFAGSDTDTLPTPEKVWPPAPQAGVDAGDLGTIVDVASGRINSLVLTTTGLFGAGDNSYSQLFIPEGALPEEEAHQWTRLPVAVRAGSDAGAVDAGGDPIAKLFRSNGSAEGCCYITAAGKLHCWGENDYGQAGSSVNENKASVTIPTLAELPSNVKATQVTIANGGICATTEDGSLYCWGDNSRGAAAQDPPMDNLPSPKKVVGVTNATAVAVGTRYFGCAVTAEHKTYCWGDNGYGQRGYAPDGGDSQFSITPNEVPLTW